MADQQIDALFGTFDPEKVKTYFASNASGLLTKVTAVIESNKHLLIYQSQADPYTVFLKTVSNEGFNIDDIILLISMVICYGRSLKSLNKQKDGEAGKAFLNVCNKYRIMYNYNKKKMEGEARKYTTKCEHIFAAFPYVAQVCQTVLVEKQLVTITTPFTLRGMDFQSSTALSLWSNPDQFAREMFLHELKNQLYIAKRTAGVDYMALAKRTIYKPTGEEMTMAQARERQALDSRSYTILGMCSPDLVVKLLWAVGINCPPFKSKPAYMFIDSAAKIASKSIATVVQPIMGEDWGGSVARCTALASQSGITAQFQTVKKENPGYDDLMPIGLAPDVFAAKVYLFMQIAMSLAVKRSKVQAVMSSLGYDDIGAATDFKVPTDEQLFDSNSTAYAALISHLRGH